MTSYAYARDYVPAAKTANFAYAGDHLSVGDTGSPLAGSVGLIELAWRAGFASPGRCQAKHVIPSAVSTRHRR